MRANYALIDVMAHLGDEDGDLDPDWAEFVGDRTSEYTFEVPTDVATDAYVELQAYEVDAFGHEIRVNGEALTGFDIPPAEGWQYWMDPLTGTDLRAGENTFEVVRDTETEDEFVVGTATVHWREPAEEI